MMLYRRPNTPSFMGNLPDETSIADLSLPGTHDTCAFYGGESSITQCRRGENDIQYPYRSVSSLQPRLRNNYSMVSFP